MTASIVMDIISRLPGCSGQAADAVTAYTQVKNGRCSQIIENSQIGVSGHMDTSTTTQMAQIMVQYRRPSRSSRKESLRSSYGRTIMGRQCEKFILEHGWEQSFKLGMFICQPSKRTILVCVCGRYKTSRQDRKPRTDLEISHERR